MFTYLFPYLWSVCTLYLVEVLVGFMYPVCTRMLGESYPRRRLRSLLRLYLCYVFRALAEIMYLS